MSRIKVKTTIYIEADQAEDLRLLAEATDVPAAVYVRRGIARILRAHADELEAAKRAAAEIEGTR